MKNLLLTITCLLSANYIIAQMPTIQWQNTIGGNAYDFLWAGNPTPDGGTILCGYSSSGISGDHTETSTFNDIWIVKINSVGVVKWDETINAGGTQDEARDIWPTSDGGYIIAATSNSGISGDKTEALIGVNDYWIIKIDSIGNIQWQNTIGGTNNDQAVRARQTSDGNYLIAGWSYSGISGDKTEINYGATNTADFWVLKLDASGNILWQNSIGGNDYDFLWAMNLTSDGGCILGGSSSSGLSGEKTEASMGLEDYWVVKLNSAGNVEWQNTIGGASTDMLMDVKQSADGGYILSGYSYSDITGDKTEISYGTSSDYWIVKLNASGNIQWQNSVGGNADDYGYGVYQSTDLGYLITGSSSSGITGDKNEANLGSSDVWTIKLDQFGTLKWQNAFTGTGTDNGRSIYQAADSGYVVNCFTDSPLSGDKTEANLGFAGSWDFWEVKLYPDCHATAEICNGLDENCNRLMDDGLIFLNYYTDGDADNYGNPASTPVYSCNAITGKVPDNTDCNDANTAIHPGATEICNGLDDNCNTLNDDGLTFNFYYTDADVDSYGSSSDPGINSCSAIAGKVLNNTDCNDGNTAIHPAATESCNGVDDDCNAAIDDGLTFANYYIDGDGDTYGNNADPGINSCSVIAGKVLNSTDCNDANASIHPGVTEICNTLDDNCNGSIDEGISVTVTISAGGPTSVCQGSSVVLTAVYSGTTVQWKKNGAIIPGATNAIYTATQKGLFTAFTSSACGSATSTGINVVINKNPAASVTAGGPTTFCTGGSVVLTEAPTAGCSYQWYKGAAVIAGATNTNYTATTNGNFKCRVTKVATGCYRNSNSIMVTVPCRDDVAIIDDENTFSIYPNPNTGIFTIIAASSAIPGPLRLSAAAGETFITQLEIYNSLGQIIYSEQLNPSNGEINETIDLSDIPPGVYFVRLNDGYHYSEQKIVIE